MYFVAKTNALISAPLFSHYAKSMFSNDAAYVEFEKVFEELNFIICFSCSKIHVCFLEHFICMVFVNVKDLVYIIWRDVHTVFTLFTARCTYRIFKITSKMLDEISTQ